VAGAGAEGLGRAVEAGHLPGGRVTGHEGVAEADAEAVGAGAGDACLQM
jgi:hypothetical protein